MEAAADQPAAMNDSEVIDLTTAEAEEEHPGPVPRSPRTVHTSTVKIHTSILKVHQEQFRRTLALFRMQVLKINPAIDPGLLFFDQPNPLNPLLPIKRRLHIDIYKLWHEVSRLGGHVRVNENNWWGIVSGICLPNMNQLDTLRRSFADSNESANMNQYPSTLQICFLKYHEVLKTFDDALILIDDTFKLDVGYTPNQLTHAKWQTWAYLQMKEGNFAEVRERNDMLTQQPLFVEYQTDRLRRQLNLFRVLSSQASGFLGASPHEFATMILEMKTHGVNSRMSLVNKAGLITGLSTDDENSILKMKTQMAATPTEPQHNQVGAPAQLTELRAYFQIGVQQTPQSVHAEPEYEPSVLSLPGQRLSPHGPKRPVGRPWKVPHSPVPQYEPSDPFPMPPPPTAGSWECIATTPAQMATLSEALRGIDVGGLPKPVDAVPSSGSLPSVEKAIGSSDQLRLAEVLKRVASIWAVSRELVKQDHEREARKQAKLKEERRLEEERHENRRLKAVADREHAILREEARLRVYDMEVRASGRGKRARKKVNYDERRTSFSAWTAAELVALEAGVKAHGVGEYPPMLKQVPTEKNFHPDRPTHPPAGNSLRGIWVKILKDPKFATALKGRSNKALSDKWRTFKTMETGKPSTEAKTPAKRQTENAWGHHEAVRQSPTMSARKVAPVAPRLPHQPADSPVMRLVGIHVTRESIWEGYDDPTTGTVKRFHINQVSLFGYFWLFLVISVWAILLRRRVFFSAVLGRNLRRPPRR